MADDTQHFLLLRGFVEPQTIHKLLALYLTVVWLIADTKVPLGVFEGIPIYVVLTPAVLLILGRRAITAAVVIATLLLAYEFLKNFQGDYRETSKALLGILALSALLPTIYYSL